MCLCECVYLFVCVCLCVCVSVCARVYICPCIPNWRIAQKRYGIDPSLKPSTHVFRDFMALDHDLTCKVIDSNWSHFGRLNVVILQNRWQIEQIFILPKDSKSLIGIRMEHLHLILIHSKYQSQGNANFDCVFLTNGSRWDNYCVRFIVGLKMNVDVTSNGNRQVDRWCQLTFFS